MSEGDILTAAEFRKIAKKLRAKLKPTDDYSVMYLCGTCKYIHVFNKDTRNECKEWLSNLIEQD